MVNLGQRREIGKIGKVLLTGHTGFKGTWATLMLEALGIEVVGLSLPAEQDSLYNLLGRKGLIEEYIFDISDRNRVAEVIKRSKIQTVIHMAAQPLVLLSYQYPVTTFETNVMGTVNVLNASFLNSTVETVVIVTTDKVYENKNTGKRFIESDSLFGKDPYSASKVGAEAAVAAWSQISRTKGGPTLISARAGNVIGGGDFAENRIIPDIVRGFLTGKSVEIRNPDSTRPWQHALDPISGYFMAAIDATLNREHYSINFGPKDQSLEVTKVAELAKDILGRKLDLKYSDKIHANFESHLLDLDSTFAQKRLGWNPVLNQIESIKQTFQWWKEYEKNRDTVLELCNQDINTFVNGHGFVS